MRDRTSWRAGLTRKLGEVRTPGINAGRFIDVELGLSLLMSVAPGEPADILPELLTGYPVLAAAGIPTTLTLERSINVARYLLLPLRTRRDWSNALATYLDAPVQIRAYDLVDGIPQRLNPSVAPGRFDIYARTLATPPPLRPASTRVASAGPHEFLHRGSTLTVTLPDDLAGAAGVRHATEARTGRSGVTMTLAELEQTARWMDDQEVAAGLPPQSWLARVRRVSLEVRRANGGFEPSDTLAVDRLLHLIGMVGSGKSTVMVLLAAAAARRGLTTTVVVGDVITALRMVGHLEAVGLRAAPIVGASTHETHVARLHQLRAFDPAGPGLLHDPDSTHDLLSTACALDALLPRATLLDVRDAPCERLNIPSQDGPAEARRAQDLTCPMWSRCQRHRGAVAAVDAEIWVATAPSLVHTRVPAPASPHSMRYLELAWRRSDLIVIDEADRVQAQLDAMFSPGQTLIGHGGDAWIDEVADHTDTELRRQARRQFGDRHVREWSSHVDRARTVANRLYALLQREPLPRGETTIRRWIGRDCFSEWTLANRMLHAWCGSEDDPAYAELRAGFDAYLPDPLGEHDREDNKVADSLRTLTSDLLNAVNESEADRLTSEWLEGSADHLGLSQLRDACPLRLELTLLLAVLSNTLTALLRRWRAVDGELNLDAAGLAAFQRPPDDYAPVMPIPPMGSILGYQYHDNPDATAGMGNLRFFRCSGVGRWLLLHLHELFSGDSPDGPAVLLMSGTSWAGTSPRYDVQHAVGAILRAPQHEHDAINRTSVTITPLYDNRGEPIAVSGRRIGAGREEALRAMADALTRRPRQDRPSQLERERALLPPDRQRILLLVGSYAEARVLANALLDQRSDWQGQVLRLVADDELFATQWQPVLRRGDVARLPETDAWILVAPLLAIERGHNIINADGRAAIGSAMFLVRPHPRPDDITYPVQAMNRWAVQTIDDLARHPQHGVPVGDIGRSLRSAAYRLWQRHLLGASTYAALPEDARRALAWTEIVTIWQVVGRLVRGGSPARVHFCDAAFARNTARRDAVADDASTSLVFGMIEALGEYLATGAAVAPDERHVAEALYGPFYRALLALPGAADAAV